MAFFKVALVLLGLAAVTSQAFGNPHESENNYQLFHKKRVGRGKRSQDDSTGRVISQDLINRLLSLKSSTSSTTATTTTTTYTSPTTTGTSPTTTTTTNTTTGRAPQYIVQRFSLNDFAYDDEIDDEEDNFRCASGSGNSYDNYNDDIYDDYDNDRELNEDDADEQDNAILVENEQSSFDEVGRAARARPSNWRRRQAQRRRQQRQRRRRQQALRRRPNQRRRRGNPKKRVYRRRGQSNRRRRRPSANNRTGNQRRRILRITV